MTIIVAFKCPSRKLAKISKYFNRFMDGYIVLLDVA